MNTLARTAIATSRSSTDDARSTSFAPGIGVVTDPRAIEDEWRRFERTAIGHVFQTFDFVRTWLDQIGARETEARIVVGRDEGGRILFLLPFGYRRCLGAGLLEWLGGAYADYHGGLFAPQLLASIAGDAAARSAFVDEVIAPLRDEADVVHFRRQPESLGVFPNPFVGWHAGSYRMRAHWTRLSPDWETYYRSKRNSSSRRHDRLKWQKMASLGPISVVDADGPAEARRILAALFVQKDKALTAGGIPPYFADPKVRAFYEAMATRLYPEGPAHVSGLELDGRIVATNWGLVRGNRYYYVMTSYEDGPVSRFSPGRALMRHLMRWSIDRGIEEFDFTVGDEAFKSHWCEENEFLYGSLKVLHPRGAVLGAALRGVQSTRQVVTASPQLTRLANQLRSRLAARRG